MPTRSIALSALAAPFFETEPRSAVAEILNQADEISSELILGEIEEANPEMAAQSKQKMFVFEDILLVNLVGTAWFTARMLAGRAQPVALERWQTGYLPVFAVWVTAVVLVLPPVFAFA